MEINDHRRLGSELKLYHIQENAPGMVFWHPRGYAVYRVLEDYIRKKMRGLGYKEVRTPQLLPRELWEQSGHWDKFKQNMYCVSDEDEHEFALKPMSCPCHVQIFNQGIRSWRELPIRYAEFGACHRNEPSGSMHGLMRTRAFEQDDAHVLCREDDVQREVARFIGLLHQVYVDLGFANYEIALSTRPQVRAGSDELWDWAEEQLALAAKQRGVVVNIQPGEGAFYGPKLEFVLKDRQGRSWQCGTVQLDVVLPKRLGASYIDKDGKPAVPMMIHHAVFGSMGRFLAILLEEHNGNLPYWLSPEQVAVIPIAEGQLENARSVHETLFEEGVRSVLYEMNESLSRKLVHAHNEKIPVSLIIGRRESEAGQVTVREADVSQVVMSISEAVDLLRKRR
jgi:threonyl-tRNA synthetase